MLRQPMLKIARQHPHYGYRKVACELRAQGWKINHKLVRKLQKAWELPLIRSVRSPARSRIRIALSQMGHRINLLPRLVQIEPLKLLYTDFTELPYDRNAKKAFLMPLIDHLSKRAVGWAVGSEKNSALALRAWTRARGTLKRYGVDPASVVIHHDQDGVYTGHQWLHRVRVKDGARVSYSLNGARGNTAMESFNGHFKLEAKSILWEQKDLLGVIKVVESRMHYYNDIRRHESIGQIAPEMFLQKHGLTPRWVSTL